MTTLKKDSRIPRNHPKFDLYIKTAVAFLQGGGTPNNGIRLGLTAADITQAQSMLAIWYTGNAASPGIYEQHTNPNTRTKVTTRLVKEFIINFSAFFRSLLNSMAGNKAITPADRAMLNIAAPNPARSQQRLALVNTVYFEGKPIGGGELKVYCRTVKGSKRGSKAPGSDSVELSYKLGDPAPTGGDDPNNKHEIFSRAEFIMPFGASNAGQKVHLFARWINSKHKQLAGPWSPVTSVFLA